MNKDSRYQRFEKRRKNTKLLTILAILGGALALILLVTTILPFGGEEKTVNDQPKTATDDSDQTEYDSTESSQDSSSTDTEGQEDSTETPEESSEEDSSESNTVDWETTEETVEESDKENVEKVITRDWKPIGTEQEGSHRATFKKGTQDWDEMVKAIHVGAGLQPSNSILWYVGNGGDAQSAIGTITDKSQQKIYRVYVEWIDQKGWKPVKVEVLEENDKK